MTAPEQDPDPDPLEMVVHELGPIPGHERMPELVMLELAFVPLPEPDVAEVIAAMARDADDLQRFVTEYNARLDDPRELAELLAGIAERDAETMRWVGGAP